MWPLPRSTWPQTGGEESLSHTVGAIISDALHSGVFKKRSGPPALPTDSLTTTWSSPAEIVKSFFGASCFMPRWSMNFSSSSVCGIFSRGCQQRTELGDLVHRRERNLVFRCFHRLSLFNPPSESFHVEGPRFHSFLFIPPLWCQSRLSKHLNSIWGCRVQVRQGRVLVLGPPQYVQKVRLERVALQRPRLSHCRLQRSSGHRASVELCRFVVSVTGCCEACSPKSPSPLTRVDSATLLSNCSAFSTFL